MDCNGIKEEKERTLNMGMVVVIQANKCYIFQMRMLVIQLVSNWTVGTTMAAVSQFYSSQITPYL